MGAPTGVALHESRHVSGGADALQATDFIDAIVKRIRESSGPTDLVLGSVADGEYLKRNGSTIVGGVVTAAGSHIENGFRLTASTGNPVPTSDVASTTSLYLSPYVGDAVWTFDSSVWTRHASSGADITLALGTVVSGSVYDVFVFWNGSALALEKLVWTNNTTRATAIVQQNGVWVKSGAADRRYVGTFVATSTTQTCDTKAQRYVWSYANRVLRTGTSSDATASWSTTSSTPNAMNGGNAAWKREFVQGLNDMPCTAIASVKYASSPAANHIVGWGLDSTTTQTTDAALLTTGTGTFSTAWAFMGLLGGVGYHFLQVLQSSSINGSSVNFSGATSDQSAGVMTGWWC